MKIAHSRGASQVSSFAVLLVAALVACSDASAPATEPPAPPTPPPRVPAQLRLSADSVTLRALGDTTRIAMTVLDQQGQPVTNVVGEWETSNAAVASVATSGLVTALTNGSTIVTAKVGTVAASAVVTVRQVPAQIRIVGDTLPLVVRTTRALDATVLDGRGNVMGAAPIAWASSNPEILSVAANGTVTGVALGGPVIISAASDSVSVSVRIAVRDVIATSVAIATTRSEFKVGEATRLRVYARGASGDSLRLRTFAFRSNNPAVAVVDSAGVVTAVGAGRTEIVATETLDGVTGSISIVVRGLLHRWQFNESGTAGTSMLDDVGGAVARIIDVGPNDAVVAGGAVTLAGGSWASSDYVLLPAGMLSKAPNATIEVWAALHSIRNWSRVFDIGSGNANNLFVSWSNGANASDNRVGMTVAGSESRIDGALAPFTRDFLHHIVLTIADSAGTGGTTLVQVYLDGEKRGSFETTHRLGQLEDRFAMLGRSSYPSDETAHASYHEVRVHDRVYSDAEISLIYRSTAPTTNAGTTLVIARPDGLGDRIRGVGSQFRLRAILRDAGGRLFPALGVRWHSGSSNVTIDSAGVVTAVAEGSSHITASFGAQTASWSSEVVQIVRKPVDSRAAVPAAGALWEVPVMLIAYLPSADAARIDVRKSPDFWWLNPMPLDSIEARCLDFTLRRKMMAEEGSRFRGYKNPLAVASLGYRVVEQVFVYEQGPASAKRSNPADPLSPRHYDFRKIFDQTGATTLIPSQGIKEVWFCESGFDKGFPSYDPAIHNSQDFRTGWESNMSSPRTGDVSNSDQDPNDLPLFNHTYIVYGIAFRRSQAEAMHNVGHQLERMMSWANWRQDGNTNLFWRQFVGQDNAGQFVTGRAGWTHMPPNTIGNYDYHNTTLVPSDIEDWRPDNTGVKTTVNNATWSTLRFPWPGVQEFGQREESQFYLYWMQSYPGRGNQIQHPSGWMTNWWEFVGDWDGAAQRGLGLYAPTAAASVDAASRSVRSEAEHVARWPVPETRSPARPR